MLNKIIKNYFLFTLLALLSNPVFSTPEQSVAEGEVSRALFTSAVHNREPIDQLNILSELISEVFFFTEFKNYQGHTLTHQWSHNHKISHSIPFEVKGKRWRVFSSKTFVPGAKQEGTWTVKILDEAGNVISENSIDYIRPSTDAEILAGKEASEAAAAKQLDQDNEKTPESSTDNTTANTDEKNKPTTDETDKPESPAETTDEDSNPVDKTEETEPVTKADDAKEQNTSNTQEAEGKDSKTTMPEDKTTASPQTQADKKDDAVETKPKDKPETSSEDSEDKETDNSDPTKNKETTENTDSPSSKPIWDKIK